MDTVACTLVPCDIKSHPSAKKHLPCVKKEVASFSPLTPSPPASPGNPTYGSTFPRLLAFRCNHQRCKSSPSPRSSSETSKSTCATPSASQCPSGSHLLNVSSSSSLIKMFKLIPLSLVLVLVVAPLVNCQPPRSQWQKSVNSIMYNQRLSTSASNNFVDLRHAESLPYAGSHFVRRRLTVGQRIGRSSDFDLRGARPIIPSSSTFNGGFSHSESSPQCGYQVSN